jgi:hypothetical protein
MLPEKEKSFLGSAKSFAISKGFFQDQEGEIPKKSMKSLPFLTM